MPQIFPVGQSQLLARDGAWMLQPTNLAPRSLGFLKKFEPQITDLYNNRQALLSAAEVHDPREIRLLQVRELEMHRYTAFT